ncbi:hypothetical protein N9948_00610 [bacterium]|nr:hypothetical protein [bacterium]
MEQESLDKLLIEALKCSLNYEHSKRFVSLLSEDGLYLAFCDLQANVNDNNNTKEKCTLIIDRITDQETLKEMVINTPNYILVGEALAKITSYSKLKKIAELRPDLETHIKGRLGFVSNANRFILDD